MMNPNKKKKNLELLDSVARSANRLSQLHDIFITGGHDRQVCATMRVEIDILFRRLLKLWIRMKLHKIAKG